MNTDIITRALDDLKDAQGILRAVEGDKAHQASLRISMAVGRLKAYAQMCELEERSE